MATVLSGILCPLIAERGLASMQPNLPRVGASTGTYPDRSEVGSCNFHGTFQVYGEQTKLSRPSGVAARPILIILFVFLFVKLLRQMRIRIRSCSQRSGCECVAFFGSSRGPILLAADINFCPKTNEEFKRRGEKVSPKDISIIIIPMMASLLAEW